MGHSTHYPSHMENLPLSVAKTKSTKLNLPLLTQLKPVREIHENHRERGHAHSFSLLVFLQNILALPGRCSPYELITGKQPNLTCLRTFGCETMACIEKPKRAKFEAKTERCIYLGPSSSHSHDTCKLWQLSTGKIIIRRNMAFTTQDKK
jgi:hypothetical protein